MAKSDRRRHYRVAQKAPKAAANPVFSVKKRDKNKWIAAGIVFTVLIFAKGLLLGMWLSKD